MSYAAGGAAAAAGAGAAAQIAQAIKASGAIVRLEPNDFMTILSKCEYPLVVVAQAGIFKKHLQYLTGYKGLVFFTKSETPLPLTSDVEAITAKSIWIPA